MDTRSCQESLPGILGHITHCFFFLPSYAVAYYQTAFPSFFGSHVAHLGTEAATLFCVARDRCLYIYLHMVFLFYVYDTS